MFHISTLSTRTPHNIARCGLPAAAILLAVASAARAGDPIITSVTAIYDNYGFVQDAPGNSHVYSPGSSDSPSSSSLSGTLGGASFSDSVSLSLSSSQGEYHWLATLTTQAAVDGSTSPQGLAQASTGLEMLYVTFTIDHPTYIYYNTDTSSDTNCYPYFASGALFSKGKYEMSFSGSYLQGDLISAGSSYSKVATQVFNIVFATPEPASLTVLGIGAAALLGRRRNRRA